MTATMAANKPSWLTDIVFTKRPAVAIRNAGGDKLETGNRFDSYGSIRKRKISRLWTPSKMRLKPWFR